MNKAIKHLLPLASSLLVMCLHGGVFGATKQTARAITNKTITIPNQKVMACPFCAPSAWVGKQFVILPKTAMMMAGGYGLFTLPRSPAVSSVPVNSSVEFADHRLKCEPFQGKTITITQVKPVTGGEYTLTAGVDSLDMKIFAQTRNNTVEGLALKADLDSAQRRWLGKTVYARRRMIEVYDSISGNFSQVKVSISEPLKVLRITWGQTPLPPQPLWLHVGRTSGMQGIIAARFSWVNVQPGLRTGGNPWDEAILDEETRLACRWDQVVWEAIDNHTVFAGMTRSQVLFAWGQPRKQVVAIKGRDTLTQWLYDASSLSFKRDTLLQPQ